MPRVAKETLFPALAPCPILLGIPHCPGGSKCGEQLCWLLGSAEGATSLPAPVSCPVLHALLSGRGVGVKEKDSEGHYLLPLAQASSLNSLSPLPVDGVGQE